MRPVACLAVFLSLGAAPVPAEDAAVLRATLALAGARGDAYCVTAVLEPAPFEGVRRELVERAEMEEELREVTGAPASPPASEAAAIRGSVEHGWTGDDLKPLDPAQLARIVGAATVLASRGDSASLPDAPVADLNMMDAPDLDEAASDAAIAAAAARRGRIEPSWLTPAQRLADRCDYPTASLSEVAREGDLAFVSVGLVWAPLAGIGETWVMRRGADGWRRVARRRDWIA